VAVIIVNLDDDLEEKIARMDAVTQARVRAARKISADAAARTPVGRTGRARDSHRVEVNMSADPPDVVVTAGGGDAWYYVFHEFGGAGFRPPPAPLRTAAKSTGKYVDER